MSDRTRTIFYHGDCLDGFGAAWCAWRRFGDSADYYPMRYGDRWPAALVDGREVFILDFSGPQTVVRDLARRAGRLLLLDHHVTPCKDWQALLADDAGRGLRRHDDADLALTVAFDMRRSGARLAWDWFFPEQPLPRAIAHVEDQDLWRFDLPGTQAYCRALRCHPFEFAVWDALVAESGGLDDAEQSPGYRQMLTEGAAIEAFVRREVAQLAAAPALTVSLRGEPLGPGAAPAEASVVVDGVTYRTVTGLCVNANAMFASELGEALALRSGSFGMTWQMLADGRVKASLRAAGAVNVASIAEQYGGGGHPNSAGMSLAFADFAREVLRLEG